MTILDSILACVGASICGGAPWDVLKFAGGKIVTSFKNKFITNGCFKNESECIDFLKKISSKEPNSEKNPYKDVQIIYEDIIESPKEDFHSIFKKWLDENAEEFKQIGNFNSQHVSVKISHQENNGAGTIINAGIINNN